MKPLSMLTSTWHGLIVVIQWQRLQATQHVVQLQRDASVAVALILQQEHLVSKIEASGNTHLCRSVQSTLGFASPWVTGTMIAFAGEITKGEILEV